MAEIRYVHTSIAARDWELLARFYTEVFGCELVPPERDLSGSWIEAMTALPQVRVRGVHLRLPGCGKDGPALEIFSFDPAGPDTDKPINRTGFTHLAFHVDDVEAVLGRLEEHGGRPYGEVVQNRYPELGMLTAVYATDPEGNILEIQNWSA